MENDDYAVLVLKVYKVAIYCVVLEAAKRSIMYNRDIRLCLKDFGLDDIFIDFLLKRFD